jgi:carbon starvation protein
MNSLVLTGLVMGGYLLAYHTYGKFLARKIFNINPDAVCPSAAFQDNFDFIPTKKEILFGHHFTSIAGLGPIVGPAIAIIWGWVPAVIWIFFGAIFFGAVHDFGALVISLRAKGRSIGDITGDLINARSQILFLLIIFFALLIVIAVFGLIMAILFTMYPAAVIPVWFEIIIALCLGHIVYKKGADILWPSIIAVIIMYLTVVAGVYWPVDLKVILGISAEHELMTWIVIVLLFSSWLASSLPVQTLMQPRDFINSHQLLIAMALLCLGISIAHPSVVAPATNFSVKGAPPILPFIFVIIACGAISGFHSLVSSGTTSKQCASESDAQFIGYGSLLMEGTLATLVIIAVSAGIGLGLRGSGGEMLIGKAAFLHQYSSWEAASGLGSKLGAFIYGSGNMIQACGIPYNIAIAIMSVFVVSFASTTIDTATRIQRYVVVELACSYNFNFLAKRQVGTAFAVITAGFLAFYDGTGKGALKLWPLFGSVNQLLASLSLMIISIYLAKQKIGAVYTFLPMIFMIGITCWALTLNLNNFFLTGNWLLFFIGIFIFALQVWLIIEGLIIWKKIKSLQ